MDTVQAINATTTPGMAAGLSVAEAAMAASQMTRTHEPLPTARVEPRMVRPDEKDVPLVGTVTEAPHWPLPHHFIDREA